MKVKLPTRATVIASIALLVSLSGTAIAAGAVPLAKKALFANNSAKLQGKTAAEIAATSGPASTAVSLVATASTSFSLAAGVAAMRTATCPSGSKAVAGGASSPDPTFVVQSWPSGADSWSVVLLNGDDGAAASGTVYAVCVH